MILMTIVTNGLLDGLRFKLYGATGRMSMAEHCACHWYLSFSLNRKSVRGWTHENRITWKLIMKPNTMTVHCVPFLFGANQVFTNFVVWLPVYWPVTIDRKKGKNIAISLNNEYVFQFERNQPILVLVCSTCFFFSNGNVFLT